MKTNICIWKEIPEFEGLYEISITGIVRGIERTVNTSHGIRRIPSRIIAPRINNCGYSEIRLSKNGSTLATFVHRLIAKTFISNILNLPIVDHINGNKLDNRIENLRWVTHQQNVQYAYDLGTINQGFKCKKVIDECSGLEFESVKKAAEYSGINYKTMSNYLSGRRRNPTCLKYPPDLLAA